MWLASVACHGHNCSVIYQAQPGLSSKLTLLVDVQQEHINNCHNHVIIFHSFKQPSSPLLQGSIS
jgi:hypothetical protein